MATTDNTINNNNNEKVEYFIVDRKILPIAIQNVIKVNELIDNDNMSIYDAVKLVGISRSTYYKYKDFIKPFFESSIDRFFYICLKLQDKPGILSQVLEIIAANNMNILTIIQNIAIDGLATVTLGVQVHKSTTMTVDKMVTTLSALNGIKDIRIVENPSS